MAYSYEDLATLLRETHSLNNASLTKLLSLQNCVFEQQRRMNLLSSKDVNNLWITLANESCFALPFLPDSGSVLDVGSGNGIPGLVLAVVRPDLQFSLSESVNKKAVALERIRSQLNLQNVTVLSGPVQTIKNQQFNVITARAVAPFPTLWLWTTQVRMLNTRYLLFRGSTELQTTEAYPDEIQEFQTVPAGNVQLWIGDVVR